MSSATVPATKKPKKNYDWAFDIMTQFASSDSDSDDQELVTTDTGRSRLLIDDLDLSTREEHVTYKPNPFSIAKINAAYRPTNTVNGPVLQPSQPVRPADKPTQTRQLPKRSCVDSGQTTIMEGFKTQAMKKSRTSALQPQVPLRPAANPTVNKPIVQKSDVSITSTKSTLSTATLLSTSAAISLPYSVSTTSVPNALDLPSISSLLPEYAHVLPPKISQHPDVQTLSKISQSRILDPARLLLNTFPNEGNRADNQRPVFSSFSSPGHRCDDSPLECGPRFLCTSSPVQPARESPFRRYPTLAQSFSRKNMKKDFMLPFDRKKVSLRGSVGTLEPSPAIVKIRDKFDRYEGQKPVGGHVVRGNEIPFEFACRTPTFPSPPKPWHIGKPTTQRQHIEAQPASVLPPPPLIPDIFPNYHPKRQTPDNSFPSSAQMMSYRKCDAYKYPTEDTDGEWSTLPSRKKRKPNPEKPRNPTYTKSFCIPGLRIPPMAKAETDTTSATRRVKVYLPPPPSPVGVRCPTTNKDPQRTSPSTKSAEDRKYGASASPTTFDADAYPSPSTVKPSIAQAKRARNCTPPCSRHRVRAMNPYRPLSPPTSDLPIPSDVTDVHLEVDHEGIQLRYPEMKRLSRKRRRLSAEVWNLLGVESCGYVWRDVEGGRQGEPAEIQIVVWPVVPSV